MHMMMMKYGNTGEPKELHWGNKCLRNSTGESKTLLERRNFGGERNFSGENTSRQRGYSILFHWGWESMHPESECQSSVDRKHTIVPLMIWRDVPSFRWRWRYTIHQRSTDGELPNQ